MKSIYEESLTKEELARIPQELKSLILNPALGRAVFTRDEVVWLFNRVNLTELVKFSIFYDRIEESKVEEYKQVFGHPLELEKIGWINVKEYDGKMRYNWDTTCCFSPKSSLYGDIIGCLDTTVISQSNIILLDVRNTLILMCYRYKPVSEFNYKRLAIDATKSILYDIVKYYGLFSTDDSRLPRLLIYLLASRELLNLNKQHERKYYISFNCRFSCDHLYKEINKVLDDNKKFLFDTI